MKTQRTKRTGCAKQAERRIEGLADRLRLMIKSYGSVSMTATAISKSEAALRSWLSGDSEPKASDLRSLCEVTGTPINWLLYGTRSHGTRSAP
jgi:transcriptional regulator with XRE-family HTH domain